MNIRKLLAAIFAAALVPLVATAQTYDNNQNSKVVGPAIPEPNAVFSSSCSTPLTPTTCGSFVSTATSSSSSSVTIYNFGASGVGSYSFQITNAYGGTFQFEASDDCVNFVTTGLAQSGTTPLTTTTTATAPGIYTGIGAARACVAIVATVAPSQSTTITPFASQKIGDVGLFNSAPLTVANPTAFPSFPSTFTINGIPAPQYAPTPVPTLIPIGTVSTGTTQYKYSFANLAATSAECDVENMDGTAIITPSIAFDAADANTYPEESEEISVQPPLYGFTITTPGQYVFDVRGAYWLNLPITTAGATQNATIQCVPRYSGGVPFSFDANSNLKAVIGESTPLPVSTPNPAPTATAGWISVVKGCPSPSPITINGVNSCSSDSNGHEIVSGLLLRSSANLGTPDTSGIFPDNPANAACNTIGGTSYAGAACSAALTTTTAFLVTGTSGKTVHVMGLQFSNSSTTGTTVALYPAASGACTTAAIWGPQWVPPGGSLILPVSVVPYVQTSNNGGGLCAGAGTAVTSIYVTAQVAIF